MRLIDADALKDGLRNLKVKGANPKYVQGMQDAIDGYFPQIIDDEPTIEAKPIKHGRWYHDREGYARCSICNEHEPNEAAFFYTYCPNCGNIMDGGAENV